MKSVRLLLVTLGALLVTGVVLAQWVKAGRHVQGPPPAHRDFVRTQDPPLNQAFERWRRGEPRHWRDCLLQH